MAAPPAKVAKRSTEYEQDLIKRPVRDVDEDVRNVERQIEKVEGEIATVERKIESIEGKFAAAREDWEKGKALNPGCTSPQEYAIWLEVKEKQLRDKEKQLRTEKTEWPRRSSGSSTGTVEDLLPAEQRFFEALAEATVDDDSFLTLPIGVEWLGGRMYGRSMLVRECYAEMYEKIARSTFTYRNFVVTGSPGIGKSVFSLYYLYRKMKEKKVVLYETGSPDTRVCYVWKVGERVKTVQWNLTHTFFRELWLSEAVVLVDSKRDLVRRVHGETVVFSSPRERNFHDFWKEGAHLLFMPVWTLDELERCRSKIYGENLPKVCMEKAAELVGGIPRYVLDAAAESVKGRSWSEQQAANGIVSAEVSGRFKNALDNISEPMLRTLLRFGGIDKPRAEADNLSHQLVHIDTDDYVEKRLIFASGYVWKELLKRYKGILFEKAKKLVVAGENSSMLGSVSENIFERLVHLALQLCPNALKARALTTNWSQGQDLPDDTVVPLGSLRERKEIAYRRLEDLGVIQPCVHYRPESKVNAAIDSFVVVDDKLFLIKITVADRHGVLMYRVQEVLNRVQSGKRVFLLFVTSAKMADSFSAQNYLTKDRKKAKRVPQEVQEIVQLVLGVKPEMLDCVEKSSDKLTST